VTTFNKKITPPDAEMYIGLNTDEERCTDYVRTPDQNLLFIYGLQGLMDEVTIYDKNLGSAERLDRAAAARDSAQANLDSARARLEELLTGTTPEELRQAEEAVAQADARLSSLAIDLERHSTTAPLAGVVDSLLYETGERPSIGQPVAILLPGTQPHARIFIPEAIRVSVTPGTSARVFVDGQSQSIEGRVRWVASEAAFTPYYALTERDRGRLTFAAKVDLINVEQRLPDGIPVEVELLVDQSGQ